MSSRVIESVEIKKESERLQNTEPGCRGGEGRFSRYRRSGGCESGEPGMYCADVAPLTSVSSANRAMWF